MARIFLDQIAHSYQGQQHSDPEYALLPFSQEWQDGGAYALLGPSGCGKTTLLNIISGLLTPSEGRIKFDQQDVTELAPEQRNIAQVFQFPVVYDSMTVEENLAFPLLNQKLDARERKRRVDEVLSQLDLQALAKKKARNLGADTRQKISLGRGLVRTDANAILFDEPLTVIDAELKWRLRAQLKKIHQQFQHTMIYVTHDQTEALTFADRVAVMEEGRILQTGTPEELFNSPAHTFVGRFIGSPGMNILPCTVQGQELRIDQHSVRLQCQYLAAGPELEFGIRPEFVELVERGTNPAAVPVTITSVEDLGRIKIVKLMFNRHEIQALLKEHQSPPALPAVVFQPQHIRIYRDSLLLEPGEV